MNSKKIEELAYGAEVWSKEGDFQVDLEVFAELIIKEHLSIWEMMDNGNAVAGYVEMEDYPKAILKHFGVK